MLWFALMALPGVCLAQEQRISYSTNAVSAKVVVAALAQKTGLKLDCSPTMEGEILILRLKDAPVDVAMSKIAAVSSGTWTKEGDITYLTKDTAMRSREESKLIERDAGRISASLKKQLDAFEKQKKALADQKDSGLAGMAGMFGGSEPLVQIAMAIGPARLASIGEGERVVFSSRPTRVQASLPSSAMAYVDQFVTDYNKMAANVKQEQPAIESGDEQVAALMDLFGNKIKNLKPITSAPAKALVVVTHRSLLMGFNLELKLYDADGKVLASSSMPITTDLPFDPTKLMKPQAAPKNEGKELQLSPLASELYKVNSSFSAMGSMSTLKFSPELMAELADPVKYDPLSFVHSEALMQIAEQRDEQLVADLPDSVMSFYDNLVAKGKLTAESFLGDIKGEDKAAVEEKDGWLVVSPDNPVQARQQRMDRGALRTLIQAAQTKGYASLDDLATYALKNSSPLEGAPASATYVMLFAPNALQQGMMGMVNWDLLRFYGTLGTAQRQNLRQGAALPFGQLSPQQQQILTKMLFGADELLTVEQRRDQGVPKQDPFTQMVMQQIQRFAGGNESDYRTEPTEVMPNGLPQNGFVSVDFATETIGQPQKMSTDLGRNSTMGAMELGMLKFFKEDPNMSQVSGAIPVIDDFKMGTRSAYNFSFNVAPQVSEKGTLNDDVIPKDGPVYKMENLPADFQKKIDDMAAAMKNNPLWKTIGKLGGFGQRAVPPQ